MRRLATVKQARFPRLEADGQTHARDCECARCEAGFRPSEGQREQAARRIEERRRRAQARRALERMQERKAIRQLKLVLALESEARATDALLRRQEDVRAALEQDTLLAELLRLRALGVPVDEALARAETRRSSAPNPDPARRPAQRAG